MHTLMGMVKDRMEEPFEVLLQSTHRDGRLFFGSGYGNVLRVLAADVFHTQSALLDLSVVTAGLLYDAE